MVVQQELSMQEVDRRLDPLSKDTESFDQKVRGVAQQVHSTGMYLDMPNPLTWRKEKRASFSSGIASIEEQLRTEIDSILIMGRAEEAQLARRIEFARVLLQLALDNEGLTHGDLEGHVTYDPSTYREIDADGSHLKPILMRRWFELHALRTELVERNLYLVLINVERYAHFSVQRLDLIQEGSAALFRAVDGFDWKRGLLFRTYAVHWLNQAFRSCLYNFGGTVRVPVYLQKAMKHVKRAIERLGGSNPSPEAIAKEADLAVNIVLSALAASRHTYSLDVPHMKGEDSSTSKAGVLGDTDSAEVYNAGMEELSLAAGLESAMARLSDRERFVIEMRFGIHRKREFTLSEVAAKLGVSLERVRQIQVRAIAKMRTPTLRKAIDPFLEA